MSTVAKRGLIVVGLTLVVGFSLLLSGELRGELPASDGNVGVPPEVVAEYLYAIVQADRHLYSTHVVERMQELGVTSATEQWKQQGTLPLPIQMLMMAGEQIEGQGSRLRIRLTSLSPINKANAPADTFERAGLEQVLKAPQKPYTGIVTDGDRRMFKAIYADRAVTKTCVDCHNGHAESHKGSLKLYDVMGGIVISFPSR
jgi:Protein of unknown function (DUF3365)